MKKPTTTERAGLDLMAAPPAGISLTQDNAKFPWGNPPKEADPNVALTTMLDKLEEPASRENLLKLLMAGVTIESLVESMIYKGFESGEFSLDTGLLIKGPIALYMADAAEQEEVPYRLLEDDKALERGEVSDETILRLMKKNNPRMFSLLNEEANKVIRMGSPKEAMQQVEDTQPQSFLLSEPSVAGKEQL